MGNRCLSQIITQIPTDQMTSKFPKHDCLIQQQVGEVTLLTVSDRERMSLISDKCALDNVDWISSWCFHFHRFSRECCVCWTPTLTTPVYSYFTSQTCNCWHSLSESTGKDIIIHLHMNITKIEDIKQEVDWTLLVVMHLS